jgi:hypothetical protein
VSLAGVEAVDDLQRPFEKAQRPVGGIVECRPRGPRPSTDPLDVLELFETRWNREPGRVPEVVGTGGGELSRAGGTQAVSA